MTLVDILFILFLSIFISLVPSSNVRRWLLFLLSILAIYYFQPSSPVQYLSFWLPTLTLFLVILSWLVVTPQGERDWSNNRITLFIVMVIVILISLTRYVSMAGLLTSSRPPHPWMILLFILFAGTGYIICIRSGVVKHLSSSSVMIGLILLFFLVLKLPPFTVLIGSGLRVLTQQSIAMSRSSDIQWLGYSYLGFRIIHTIRDKQKGILPCVTLKEYFIYTIFYPAITAGPIDRLQRFSDNLRQITVLDSENFTIGGQRMVIGLFKKFVLADGLSIFAINASNVLQIRGSGWMWIFLYAYAFQIFFDFAGYTDIAIGLGRIVGIILPENFIKPYLRSNLTLFWNEWHITLTQWLRAYFFFPLTRFLLKAPVRIPAWGIIFITQTSTMALIGLWHGITYNYLLWGLWHGLGLFIHNRWSELFQPIVDRWMEGHIWRRVLVRSAGVIGTFHFVALGWVWFALPSVSESLNVYRTLFGFG